MGRNWFMTLSEALESEGLMEAWSCEYSPIGYGQTFRWTWDDGSKYGHLCSIYRSDSGNYERPVHYSR